MRIDWTPVLPRKGVLGMWDRFVGPGITAAEEWLQLLGGLLLFALLSLGLALNSATAGWQAWQWLVYGVVALDLIGGVVTLSSAAAKRWYHRDSQRLLDHLRFVVPHVIHIVVITLAFIGWDLAYILSYSLLLLMMVVWIFVTPLYLRRPLAMLLYMTVLVVHFYFLHAPEGLEWFVPLLFLKLMIAYAVKEAPFAAYGHGR